MRRLVRFHLQNKILLSFLGVTIALSVIIAFLARWILVSSLTSELEVRGRAIAHSIAEHGASYVLDKEYPKLLSLIMEEAHLGERDNLVSYIFITDRGGEVVSSTFFRPFPKGLQDANVVPEGQERSMRELVVGDQIIVDIARPIKEGIYRIGTVHVGLSKAHMDSLVGKLRNTFLGFILAAVVLLVAISHFVARYIVRPITSLTSVAEELSRGNFDVQLEAEGLGEWEPSRCPAYMSTEMPCWHFDQSLGAQNAPKQHQCATCEFYKNRPGDEVVQLEDSFRNMLWSIRLYRRRLRESEEKYRSLFDSGPDPIFVIKCGSMEILDVNPRALELYGYEKEELVGTSFLKLGPDHEKEYPLTFESLDSATGCVYHPKVMHYRRGDQPLFVNAHACPITYQGLDAVIIAVTDITEMMEKDAQLIQAAKMKSLGEMSAGVAHEINQPLNTIQLGCELLAFYGEQGQAPPAETMDKVLDSIMSQVQRAKEIIEHLRAFGRKAEIFKERVDINSPIRNVLSIIRNQFELDNIHFRLALTEGLPVIMAHDNRLQQVFFNMFNNARDAINEQPREGGLAQSREILVRTFQEGSQVVAEVVDSGPGVPEEVKAKIFEPFFTTKGVGKGTGLGLAISYGIVRDYGGDIRIGEEQGRGAVFRLHFPISM
ncbi:MAG: ATP-binding protein [Desulfovibrionaceae bacterium]